MPETMPGDVPDIVILLGGALLLAMQWQFSFRSHGRREVFEIAEISKPKAICRRVNMIPEEIIYKFMEENPRALVISVDISTTSCGSEVEP
ncbi:MAG: hypothetical protein QME66_05885 [Candidatus Eisenbacteria bacterium]|nr:hypothetical protein [Candidatus Eisenbacteria bacterium]